MTVVNPEPASRTARGAVAAAVLGVVGGAVVGIAATAVAIGWALFSAVDKHAPVRLPLLIDIAIVHGTVRAESGDGVVVPTLISAVLGAVVGMAVWAARRHHR